MVCTSVAGCSLHSFDLAPGGHTLNAKTIDDVLKLVAAIIADNKKRRDPLGYFPALYRQITLQVKEGIQNGAFDDGPRMSRFDAAFANAYFAAYDAYRKHGRQSRAWQFAFDRTASGRQIILQNLLLAINAHTCPNKRHPNRRHPNSCRCRRSSPRDARRSAPSMTFRR